MSFKLMVKFIIKDGQAESFVEIMQGAKSQIEAAEGCGGVEVLHSADNPQVVVLSELWESKALHDQYAEQMRSAGSMDGLAAFLAAPPESEFFSVK